MILDAIEAFRRGERVTRPEVIHVALVVPDIRLYQLVKSKFQIIQPPYSDIRVQLHVLVEDKRDPLKDMDWQVRVALVESGLVHPEDAKITYPDQVTLGWPTENTE